jgi:hypothetical protein
MSLVRHAFQTCYEQNRTEQNFHWCKIHIQRIVTKTTHYIQNKETVKYNQTTYTCLKRMNKENRKSTQTLYG